MLEEFQKAAESYWLQLPRIVTKRTKGQDTLGSELLTLRELQLCPFMTFIEKSKRTFSQLAVVGRRMEQEETY
jgi:hypothetical protein